MVSKLIQIALNEVGYKGKKSNAQLDDKNVNTSGKYTKYARDLDNITGFYNGKKNGYDWCDVFYDWCVVQAYGTDKALELLCQPQKSTGAGCGYSMNFYKSKGRLFNTPEVGDQIFFGNSEGIYHTGLVYKVDSSKVYTVEGNTNDSEVAKHEYPLNASYIAGYGRLNFDVTETSGKKETSNSTTSAEIDYTGVITYQAYTTEWLPEVSKCDNTDNGYAGIYGKAISGVRCKPQYGEMTVQAHIKGGNWLDEISSKNYKKNDKINPTSYSGVYGHAIDCIKISSSKGYVDYRVHTIEDGWLPWVNSKTKTGTESYAGIYGHTIDGVQMK